MNEEQLIEFINWLPTAVPEFQDATPEQIVQTLNQLYESEEGQATLSQLFTAFQESKNEPQSQMFKKGGKLDQLTQKAKKGKKMCCKKKEIVQGGMVNKVIEKAQDGSKLTRRQALDAGMANRGYDRQQARLALANAMNTGRNLGMRGRELRQWARQGVAAIPKASQIDIMAGRDIPKPESITLPVEKFVFDPQSLNPITVNPIEQTFAQAFSEARKRGLSEFTWNGKRYNTQLAENKPEKISGEASNRTTNYEAPQFSYTPRSFSDYQSDLLATPSRGIAIVPNPKDDYRPGEYSYSIRPEDTIRWDMKVKDKTEDYYRPGREFSYTIRPEDTVRWDMKVKDKTGNSAASSANPTFLDVLLNVVNNSRYNGR